MDGSAVTVTPAALDLGCFVYGSARALRRTLTLANTTDADRTVTLRADAALARAAASVVFHLGDSDWPAGGGGGAAGALRGMPAEHEDSNLAEVEMTAALGAAAAQEQPGGFTALVPAGLAVRVDVLFTPTLRPPLPLPLRSALSPPQAQRDRFDGSLDPVAQEQRDGQAQAEDSEGASPAAGIGAPKDDRQFTLQPLNGAVRVSSRPGAVEGGVNGGVGGGVFGAGEATVPVSGRGCLSYLYTDTEEVTFDRCAPGKRHVKDFAVWNASEVDTHFHVSPGDPTRCDSLQIFDYETGDRIERERVHLAPFANYRVRLAFNASDEDITPSAADAVPLWLAVENVRDPRNVTYVKVATFTTNELAGAGLELSCGGKVNFGDCYAWEPVHRDVNLRNKLHEPFTVSLSSTLPEQVSFELLPAGGESAARGGKRADGDLDDSESDQGGPGRPAGSSAASGSGDVAESGGGGSGGTVGDSDRSSSKRLLKAERLQFQADQTRSLRVWYTPNRPASGPDPGRFCRQTFQLVFRQSATLTKLVAAEAQVCESVVTLGARELNLGDCDVLNEFHASVTLFNLSDLPALVQARCESKCITPATYVIKIEPRQSFDLALAFVPITLNPEYVKEIEFTNVFNRRHGATSVTVRANNVDRRCISLHAVFYKVLDPALTNEVSFGRIAANYPAVRAFRLQNVSSQSLVLAFDSEAPGVASFVPRWNVRRAAEVAELRRSTSAQNDSLTPDAAATVGDSFSTSPALACGAAAPALASPRRPASGLSRTLLSLLDAEMLTSLSGAGEAPGDGDVRAARPASTSRTRATAFDSCKLASFVRDAAVVVSLPVHEPDPAHASLLSAADAVRADLMRRWTDVDFLPLSLQANVLSGMADETQWAEKQLLPGRTLVQHVQAGTLVRANHIVLAAGEESVVCAALTTDDRAVSRRATEASLKVRLVEFDATRLERRAKACAWRGAMFSQTSFADPPPREVVLSVQVCRSPVKIRPLQILNFGVMTAGMQRHRHFCIDNSESNACLVFAIRKTRSVASGDVRLGNGYDSGRLGVVRPFSVATVPFVFRPSLPGVFREELQIVNAMDDSANQTLTVKASVLKRSNFHVVTNSPTDFGVLECGVESAHVLKFDVYNDTDAARKFAVSVIDRWRSSASLPQPHVLMSVVVANGDGGNASPAGAELDGGDPATAELQAKRDKLEHYLKKGKAAKAEVIRREISELVRADAAKAVQTVAADESVAAQFGDSIPFPDSPAARGVAARCDRTAVVEDYCAFVVAESGVTSIEITLLAEAGGRPRPPSVAVWTDRLVHARPHSRSLRDTVDVSMSADRLDRLGSPNAGRFNFTLGVFETKNRDRCHSINCSTSVTAPIPRSESTLDASELFIPRDHAPSGFGVVAAAASAAAAASSLVASAAAKALDPLDAMRAFAGRGGRRSVGEDAFGPPVPVSLPRVEFGNLQLGVAARRPIQIRNTSRCHAEYDVLVPDSGDEAGSLRSGVASSLPRNQLASVQVSGLDKPLPPGHLHTFFVALTALSPGPHSRTLLLRPRGAADDDEAHRVLLSAFCVRGDVVRVCENALGMRDATADPGSGAGLDLGYGVVDPAREYAIVKKLFALSLVDVDIHLSVRSNLSFQVLAFADAELAAPADDLVIPARGSVPLWVAVAPRLRKSEVRQGVLRKMVGGLQLVTRHGDGVRMAESTVRFSATVGSSQFSVTPTFVDLGVTALAVRPAEGVVLRGSFLLENQSAEAEAQFQLETSSSSVTLEAPLGGVLGPREPVPASGPDAASRGGVTGPSHVVTFQLLCSRPGLINEHVAVRNVLSPSLSHRVYLRAFADPCVATAAIDGRCVAVSESHVYLTEVDGGWRVCHGGRHTLSLTPVPGGLDSAATVVPTSNLRLRVALAGAGEDWCERSEATVGFGGWDAGHTACGPPFTLGGRDTSRRDLRICAVPPAQLTPRDESTMREGKLVAVEGGILLRRSAGEEASATPGVATELVLQRLVFTYSVARLGFAKGQPGAPSATSTGGQRQRRTAGDAPAESPSDMAMTTDIGDFGHCNAWRDEAVFAPVANQGRAPLQFGFEALPDGIVVERVGGVRVEGGGADVAGDSERRWYALGPLEATVIGLRICPTKVRASTDLRRPGQVCSCIGIVNRMNPSGGLAWTVVGRLTSPRLKFEGLDKRGSPDALTLCLPDMRVPGTPASSESFRVKNASDVRVALKLEFDKCSPLESDAESSSLAELLDVDLSEHVSGVDLSDATLNPGETLVVRATAIARSREDEATLLTTAFGSADAHTVLLGLLRFGCVVGSAVEPSETIQVRVVCRRGEAIGVQPNELHFGGFVSNECARDELAQLRDAASAQSEANTQVVTISNRLGLTDVRVHLKVAGMPSGLRAMIVPRTALIEPGSSRQVVVGFAKNASDRSALYGSASLLVFDASALSDDEALAPPRPAGEPVASVALHIHTSSTDDEDGLEGADDASDVSSRRSTASLRPPSARTDAEAGKSVRLGSVPPSPSLNSDHSAALSPPGAHDASAPGPPPELLPPSRFAAADAPPPPRTFPDAALPPPPRLKEGSLAGVGRGGVESVAPHPHSSFALKGCSQIAGDPNRFELNCGQFSASTEPYVRRVTLENQAAAPVDYKCIRIRPRNSAAGIGSSDGRAQEESWLTISRSGGVLSPAGERGDSQVLVLTMERKHVNVYGAYLILEAAGGREVKTVRLLMEVVADGATPGVAASYFSVLCDGRGADSRFIDYSTTMLGQLYRHRSFVVRNVSDVTLEFMLSSDLAESARSELTFSLTNAVLRKTTRIIVAPKERRRVFLLYRPMLELHDPVEAGVEVERVFNVRVTCRLVKDYQGNIRILSRCRRPSLGCASTDFLFDCADLVNAAVNAAGPGASPSSSSSVIGSWATSPRPFPASEAGGVATTAPSPTSASALGHLVKPECAALEVRNETPHLPLVFCVRNPTRFFDVDSVGEVTLHGGGGGTDRCSVTLRPNIARIRERAQYLLRERYVEEHLSVYNRRFPREFFWVRVRLAIGGAAMEFSAVTHKRAFAFSTLEGTIATFLARFAAFWAHFRRDKFAGLAAAASTAGAEVEAPAASAGSIAGSDVSASLAGAPSRGGAHSLAAWAAHVASAPQKDGYDGVLFELHYATDELIHYCLKNTSQSGLQMASMLYSYVFKHDVFATFLFPEGQQLDVPEMMISWVGQLGHFLSYFPDKRDAFRGLTELEDRFRARIVEPPPSRDLTLPSAPPSFVGE